MTRLRECRERAGLSQKYVALTFGVAPPSVANWERGKTNPTYENMARLSDLYGVSVDYLLGRTVDMHDPDIKDIDFALSGEIRELTDEEKKDILDYVRFKRAQRAK